MHIYAILHKCMAEALQRPYGMVHRAQAVLISCSPDQRATGLLSCILLIATTLRKRYHALQNCNVECTRCRTLDLLNA